MTRARMRDAATGAARACGVGSGVESGGYGCEWVLCMGASVEKGGREVPLYIWVPHEKKDAPQSAHATLFIHPIATLSFHSAFSSLDS